MHFFLTLYSGAGVVGGIHDFASKTISHGLFTALASKVHDPAQSQSLTTLGANFHRHLIGGTTNAASLDFERRRNIGQRSLEDFIGILASLLGNGFKCGIGDGLGNTTLAIEHHLVNQLCSYYGSQNRIRQHFTLWNKSATGHFDSLLNSLFHFRFSALLQALRQHHNVLPAEYGQTLKRASGLYMSIRFQGQTCIPGRSSVRVSGCGAPSSYFCLLLGLLRSVAGTSLHPLGYTSSIQSTTNDVVTNARQVTNTAATNQNHAVLLKIVAFTGNVTSTFNLVRQTDTGDFPKSRVRLLGRGRFHAQAHTTLLRATLQNRRSGLLGSLFPSLADQLIDRWHGSTSNLLSPKFRNPRKLVG